MHKERDLEVTFMFSDELSLIVDSEKQAEEILKKAKSDAKRLLEEAKEKADEILKQAELSGKESYDEAISQGNEVSDKEYESYLENVVNQSQYMAAGALSKVDEASDFIVERIVNSNVHS